MPSTPPVTIRQLASDDIGMMRALLSTFGTVFEDEDAYARAQPSDAYLASLLGGDTFIAVAAIEDDTVVGGLAAYELQKFEQERSEVYIYDLAVTLAFRRRGIATALIERLKTIAAARGAWVIYVQADYPDEAAVSLYSKLGAREDVVHFDIAVP